MGDTHFDMTSEKEALTTLIDPAHAEKEYFKDLFRYRELFFFLSWRDILVRYKQAFFGISWALFRPFLNMVLFALLFGKIAQLPSDHVNYGIFVLAGMLPWQLFSNAIIDTSNSLINNANLITKIYFPRILIPSAQMMVHVVDFSIGLMLLALLTLFSGFLSLWTFCMLPSFILLAMMFCLGTGLWLSALTVQYRDFRFIVPFMVQLGMFISPVGYGTFVIPDQWKWLFFLNPLVGIIDGFRWSFFGIYHPHILASVAISAAMILLLLISGFYYFRKMERTFADKI